MLPTNRQALPCRRRAITPRLVQNSILILSRLIVDAFLAMQETAFLDRTARRATDAASRSNARRQVRYARDTATMLLVAAHRRRSMRNAVWAGVFATQGSHADSVGLAGFREGVVTGVEVFALLLESLRC